MNKTYTPEIKARLIAEWQTLGTPKHELARKYDVPRGTVQTWTRGLEPLARINPEKIDDIDTLFTDFVSETLMALRSAARLGQDQDWLRSLPPRDAYLWFGTLADKALAALSAYEAASERLNDAAVGLHTTPAIGTRLD